MIGPKEASLVFKVETELASSSELWIKEYPKKLWRKTYSKKKSKIMSCES